MCHKIGTNFTPTAKSFFIDTDTRVIKYKSMGEDSTKLEIVGHGSVNALSIVEPADEQEKHEALIYP